MSARKSIYTLFTLCISLWICGALTACLDIPSEPTSSGKVTSLTVYVEQNGVKDSSLLKISTQDSATFVAKVKSSKHAKELTYTWYHDDEKLANGPEFKDHFIITNFVPNRVVIQDKEGNTLEREFSFILNTPPRIGSTIFPADSSIFSITENQAVEFKWYTSDLDDDNITCYLTIDKDVYNVGTLNSISQSGFTPGWHSFSIEVEDSKGDKVRSKTRHFMVQAPEEDEK